MPSHQQRVQQAYRQRRRDLLRQRHRRLLQAPIPRQRIPDRMNPLEALRPKDFREIFGFSKDGFRHVLELILPELRVSRHNNSAHLTPVQQLAIFLDFARTNSFQRAVGTQHHLRVHQSCACRAINAVARTLANKLPDVVVWPDADEARHISVSFYDATGFPYVIGLIGGTHLEIQKPLGRDPPAERFFNRKGYYSLNCMAVVDHKLRFRHFTTRHCGSCHDARIFHESHLRARLLQDFDAHHPQVLLGDEGYGCEKFLLTPIRSDRVASEAERRYNIVHKKTRVGVEHAFGILKKRFPCLLYALRSRILSNVQAIAAAAVTLHNITINIREDPPVLPPGLLEATYQSRLARGQINERPLGRPDVSKFATRNRLIENFFQ